MYAYHGLHCKIILQDANQFVLYHTHECMHIYIILQSNNSKESFENFVTPCFPCMYVRLYVVLDVTNELFQL